MLVGLSVKHSNSRFFRYFLCCFV